MHITLAQAQHALQLHANNNTITPEAVKLLLGNASVTFAQIEYVTRVQVAAAHKAENIQKVTQANVILCSNIAAHTSVYANRVRKTAAGIAGNTPEAIAAFTPQASYFQHTEVHSIVQHKEHVDKFYLYVIYNRAVSAYVHNNRIVTLKEVAQFLTPSAQRDLFNADGIVRNISQGINHRVVVRTIALSNIVSVKARKQLLTV